MYIPAKRFMRSRNSALFGSESPRNMNARIPSPVWNQSDCVMNSL